MRGVREEEEAIYSLLSFWQSLAVRLLLSYRSSWWSFEKIMQCPMQTTRACSDEARHWSVSAVMKELGVPPPHECLKGCKTSGDPQGFAVQRILPIRPDSGELDKDTRSHSAEGMLPAVPLALVEGALTVSATFIRKVGAQQSG